MLDDVNVRVALRREWTSHSPFLKPNLRTSFEPHRVAIETTDGRVVEERLQPRDSFGGHRVDTPWDPLQLAYFAGYAMWTYLTTPFLREMWRRLKVTFPHSIATHSAVQIFYFGSDGLFRRHDYDAEVLGGTPAAHYVHEYHKVSGLWSRPGAGCSGEGRTEHRRPTR